MSDTFDADKAITQAWEDQHEHRDPTGPHLTVSISLDGPRELAVTVPDDFDQWPDDKQCALIDRVKRELLSTTVDLSTRYSRDHHWEQPSSICLPCDGPHRTNRKEPANTPAFFRGRVLRITPLHPDGKPNGPAIVRHGFFTVTISPHSDPADDTIRLESSPTYGRPDPLPTDAPARIELWGPMPSDPDATWIHTHLCDVSSLSRDGDYPDGLVCIGKPTTDTWSMTLIDKTDIPEPTP